jgi:predicted dehydrogenase
MRASAKESLMAREEAVQYGVPYYGDFVNLLEEDGLMGMYVGTEPNLHLEVTREAAARGKHPLCDKPIALTLEEADEIIRLCREAGCKLVVPFTPRFQLPLMKVKEVIEGGQAGDLVSIFVVDYGKLPTKILGPADYGWLIDPREAGYGGFQCQVK